MQIKEFKLIEGTIYKDDKIIYEGEIDYAPEEIKNMEYKKIEPTGSGLNFYV